MRPTLYIHTVHSLVEGLTPNYRRRNLHIHRQYHRQYVFWRLLDSTILCLTTQLAASTNTNRCALEPITWYLSSSSKPKPPTPSPTLKQPLLSPRFRSPLPLLPLVAGQQKGAAPPPQALPPPRRDPPSGSARTDQSASMSRSTAPLSTSPYSAVRGIRCST